MKSIEVSNLKYLKTSCKLVVRTSPGTDRSRVRRNRLLKTAGACRGCRALLATGGDAPSAQRAGKIYRGSHRRLKQIRLRGNSSFGLWLLIVWVLFLLLVVVPWMIRQGH